MQQHIFVFIEICKSKNSEKKIYETKCKYTSDAVCNIMVPVKYEDTYTNMPAPHLQAETGGGKQQ